MIWERGSGDGWVVLGSGYRGRCLLYLRDSRGWGICILIMYFLGGS